MLMRRLRTVELDERLWEAVQRAAVEDGVPEAELVEAALRSYIGLRGSAVLDEIADRQRDGEPSDEEAMALAIAEIRAAREEQGQSRGA